MAPESVATIWIGDDSEAIVRLLGRQIERVGHRPVAYTDAGALLHAYCDRDGPEPDLILLDREYADHDGIRVGAALRALGYTHVLMLCTGRLDDEIREQCREHFDATLMKPIDPVSLAHIIDAAIRSSKTRDRAA